MGKIGVWWRLYWEGLLNGEGGMWQSLSVVGAVMGTAGVRWELYVTCWDVVGGVMVRAAV